MLLSLCNGSSQAKLLKTDEADEVFNVAENKINSITDIFLRKYYLDLGLMLGYSLEIFSENLFKKFFLNTLRGWSRRKCFGNSNSV